MTNTSGKVTVSREVAETIELIIQDTDFTNEDAVRAHGTKLSHNYCNPKMVAINDLPLDTLIRALYVGYEVERTPEEELAEYIRNLENEMDNTDSADVRQTYEYEIYGAEKAARILGVKLPEPTEGADAN